MSAKWKEIEDKDEYEQQAKIQEAFILKIATKVFYAKFLDSKYVILN